MRQVRLVGWGLSAAGAVALLSAAAFALAAERQAPAPVLILDLAPMPPAAPAVAAVAEAAPQVADLPPTTPDAPSEDEPAPTAPSPVLAPTLPTAAALSLPMVEEPVTADLALPPTPEDPAPKAKTPSKKDVTMADPDPAPKSETPKETASASASAPKPADRPQNGGAVSPAAYAKAVMKKVRSTRKTKGNGRGTVVVGFRIADDGKLAGVQVLQGSGNPALDAAALDHIRRAAPFPAPPHDAGRSYSFEFVGR